MLSRHPIADILRSRISIAEIVEETVDLVRAGNDLRGECASHPDRERALFVDVEQGLYRCFACGRKGDVVQWTRERARCSEAEAISILCQRVGLPSPGE